MFTVVGEALLDMVQPAPGTTYDALPGGGPLNIAVGLKRLGHATALMARFSSGALGDRVRDYALDMGLDLSPSVSTALQTTLAFASVDESGQATYDFYTSDTADWEWSADELAGLPSATQAIHTGSLAAAIPPGADRIAQWWAEQAERGQVLLSFDPNIRPALAGPHADAVRRVERLVSLSHVVKASDEDLGWLYPDATAAESIRRWAQLGPALVVLTRGPDGCLGVTPGGLAVEMAAPQVDVVDTIGAGDAFQSGLLSGLADVGRLTADAVADMPEGDVAAVLSQALLVSALTCQRGGSDPPTRAEYDAAKSAA